MAQEASLPRARAGGRRRTGQDERMSAGRTAWEGISGAAGRTAGLHRLNCYTRGLIRSRDGPSSLTGHYENGAEMNFTGQTRPLLYPGRRRKPTMSVMLVTKGRRRPLGVTPKRLRVSGTKMPPTAKTRTVTRARAITTQGRWSGTRASQEPRNGRERETVEKADRRLAADDAPGIG